VLSKTREVRCFRYLDISIEHWSVRKGFGYVGVRNDFLQTFSKRVISPSVSSGREMPDIEDKLLYTDIEDKLLYTGIFTEHRLQTQLTFVGISMICINCQPHLNNISLGAGYI
jgi:hypothetical protein